MLCLCMATVLETVTEARAEVIMFHIWLLFWSWLLKAEF